MKKNRSKKLWQKRIPFFVCIWCVSTAERSLPVAKELKHLLIASELRSPFGGKWFSYHFQCTLSKNIWIFHFPSFKFFICLEWIFLMNFGWSWLFFPLFSFNFNYFHFHCNYLISFICFFWGWDLCCKIVITGFLIFLFI